MIIKIQSIAPVDLVHHGRLLRQQRYELSVKGGLADEVCLRREQAAWDVPCVAAAVNLAKGEIPVALSEVFTICWPKLAEVTLVLGPKVLQHHGAVASLTMHFRFGTKMPIRSRHADEWCGVVALGKVRSALGCRILAKLE